MYGDINLNTVNFDEDNIYYVSIANIPSEEYVQNVSTRAYVVLDNDELVYGETSLTRNAAEVAIAANNDDIKSEIIDTVIQSVISEYYVVENTNSLKEIVVSPINTFTYTKDDIE